MAKVSMTADIVLFGYIRQRTQILLIERKHPPFKGCWALPGGFVEENETLADAAYRELAEETHMQDIALTPCPAYFDEPGRDPRGRTVTAVFWGFSCHPREASAGSDARTARWFPFLNLPELAFDHSKIIAAVVDYLQSLYDSSRPLLAGAKSMKVAGLANILDGLSGRITNETSAKIRRKQ